MAFNSINAYSGSHKAWDHVGNWSPVSEVSEGFRPSGNYKPAAWLPVKFYEKFYENWVTVLPGKILALDNQGRLVPAQYGLSAATITYGTNDVTAGVIDVRTGAALVAGDVGTFNVSAVTDFMGTGVALAVSKPVGVCPQPYLKWAGDGSADDTGFNPAVYVQHNYNMQHAVAFLCDYMLELPLVPAKTNTETKAQGSFNGTTLRSTLTALSNLPVAANTQRTTIVFANGTQTDAATRFVNQVDSVANVLEAGDWHIDLTTGVITVYAAATITGNYSITYYNYASAPTGSNVSVFASVLGDVKPGDFLKCNSDSNWVVATPKTYGDGVTDNFDTFADILGQVTEISVEPADLLDKVRTAYSSLATTATGSLPGYAGQMDQMPGSATGGVSDKIHYAGAANKVVKINLISR